MKIGLSFNYFKPFSENSKSTLPTTRLKYSEKNAIIKYAGPDYHTINSSLRGKNASRETMTHAQRERTIRLMDSGISKIAAKNQTTQKTFRGTRDVQIKQAEGSFYSEPSFLSTSRKKHIAEKFLSKTNRHAQFSVLFGRGGADLVKHNATKFFLRNEAEVLYPRNTEFQVLFRHDFPNYHEPWDQPIQKKSKVVLEEKGLAQMPLEQKRKNMLIPDVSPAIPPIDPKKAGQSWGHPSSLLDVLNLDLHQPFYSKNDLSL